MKDHRIEINKLICFIVDYFEDKKIDKSEYKGTLDSIAEIYEKEVWIHPFPLNDRTHKVFIYSKHKSFPALISFYILTQDSIVLKEILGFHRKRFEYNILINEANYDTFLSTYIEKSLLINHHIFKRSDINFQELFDMYSGKRSVYIDSAGGCTYLPILLC